MMHPLQALSSSGSSDLLRSMRDSIAQQSAQPADAFSQLLGKDAPPESTNELKDAFQDFVGQTMFGQMLKSMRSTVGKPAYFHGGRGEEVFQEQLDQLLVEELSTASASTFSDPMFELFQLQRRQ